MHPLDSGANVLHTEGLHTTKEIKKIKMKRTPSIMMRLCSAGNCKILIFVRSYAGNANNSKQNDILSAFWNNFNDKLGNLVENKIIKSNTKTYQYSVLNKLKEQSCKTMKAHQLYILQLAIEEHTMDFDENNVFKHSTMMLDKIINKGGITAKEYLKQKKCGLSEIELSYIHVFSQYTLEALLIHVLGSVFNNIQDLSIVRVSTLIEQIDSHVRYHAMYIISMHNKKKEKAGNVEKTAAVNEKEGSKKETGKSYLKPDNKLTRHNYAIGKSLLEFLIERKLISLTTERSHTATLPVVSKSKKTGYYPLHCYAICNFDLNLLPVKLNLPMVYHPMNWTSTVDNPSSLDDISGGYLCAHTAEIYNRFRVLTSRDYSHFYIKLSNPKDVCYILNILQSQAFMINSEFLLFINKNRDYLEEVGLFMNRKLARVNLEEVSDLLRSCFFNDTTGVKNVSNINALLKELVSRMQQARYEDFVLNLADAYDEYTFYLPAFMDFRGRIYRAGVLHFHERDLAKSLIKFSKDPERNENDDDTKEFRKCLASAAAFKFKKFKTEDEAYQWYIDNLDVIKSDYDKVLIDFAVQASDPFQFLSKILSNDRVTPKDRIIGLSKVPVTQDASASAYQIMSYFLLNTEMARRTNLIPSPSNEIQDLYSCLKDEIMVFLHSRLDNEKYAIIKSLLTRKLVKQVFMPLIYGKTIITVTKDISDAYGGLLSFKDYYQIALLFQVFWKNKYPDIVNLMKLINLIGWICSFLGKPVQYSVPYFTTVQDYMRSDKINIWVYDRVGKKRRRVTLRVPMLDRDKLWLAALVR